jgi:hypothetical protein
MSEYFKLHVNGNPDSARPVLEQALEGQGFRFTWENPQKGIAEKGSRTKAMLLGALSIHYKYWVQLDPQADGTVVVGLGLGTSGVSAGAVGMVKVRKKVDELQQYVSEAYRTSGVLLGAQAG